MPKILRPFAVPRFVLFIAVLDRHPSRRKRVLRQLTDSSK